LSENYHIGKEIELDVTWFNKKIYLAFEYIGRLEEDIKYYDLHRSYISNTRFVIIRLYNLDKPEFKEAYCKSEGNYVVEIENQSFVQQTVQCSKFEKF
jgi:hypothetical protein